MSNLDSYSVRISEDSRPYVCTDCKTVVAAKAHDAGAFEVGCECTTVPVVPQMGQAETPDNWVLPREDCCAGVKVSTLDNVYGDRGIDYECPDCGAGYAYDGEMARFPDEVAGQTIEIDDAQETLV